MNHLRALHSFEGLLKAESASRLHELIAGAAANLGFGQFLCGLSANLDRPEPRVFALNGAAPEWWQRYQSQAYLGIDPTVRILLRERRSIPLPWQDIHCRDARERAFMAEAAEHNLADGISFPLHARNEVGVFSLIMPQRPRHQRLIGHAMPFGHLLASYVQEAARRLMDDGSDSEAVCLTARETECLVWAAAGKTAWEISKILAISERTVVFHFGNAARKLGVSSRQQAVARAIVEGLIRP